MFTRMLYTYFGYLAELIEGTPSPRDFLVGFRGVRYFTDTIRIASL